jgi:hypothetical protein
MSLLPTTYTVLRSVITLTILPGPAISINFSCQLSNTLIACPPPSPPPRECICEKPVAWGEMFFVFADVGCELCAMPLYLATTVSIWDGKREGVGVGLRTGISSTHPAPRCPLHSHISDSTSGSSRSALYSVISPPPSPNAPPVFPSISNQFPIHPM